jgi:dUTP pyrophosphatase
VVVEVKSVCHDTLDEFDMLPRYAKEGDAGCDGKANLTEPVVLQPGERKLIPLGIAVAIPVGYEIQVRPRSGLALKHGITLANAVGTIDHGYRNEVGAILLNLGQEPFTVNPGDRICQLVLSKVENINWFEVAELPSSERGRGGFGSSGVK